MVRGTLWGHRPEQADHEVSPACPRDPPLFPHPSTSVCAQAGPRGGEGDDGGYLLST